MEDALFQAGEQLRDAATAGNTAAVKQILAQHPGVTSSEPGMFALHDAVNLGHLETALAIVSVDDSTIYSFSGEWDHTDYSPLTLAVLGEDLPMVAALASAVPEAVYATCPAEGVTPIQSAVSEKFWPAFRHMLFVGDRTGDRTEDQLSTLETALQQWGMPLEQALPMYADVVAAAPLTADQWARIPAPFPALVALLPAVLERSEAEARLLVQHLPPELRERLRCAALSLERMQQERRVALPKELVHKILINAIS